ncbi:hypothetical protein HJC23_000116 [Cyclotella cryptica]|uniref:G-protein coupled receptors family 3 profile domain-containing protein n=1 Tax=Cyclotella cryptica TaxID=29204 RepID=A0ABD3NZP8_9STRA
MSPQPYKFAVVPKSTNSFFAEIEWGCLQAASELNVTCHYTGTPVEDYASQAALIEELVDSAKYAGLALSVINTTSAAAVIAKARNVGMAVVTFDSDAPDSERQAYIGTDNLAFGDQLGKVLLQIDPTGGTYGVITGAGPNLRDRERGLRERLAGTKWKEASNGSPKYAMDDANMALEQMWEFSQDANIDTVIPLGGWPMFNETGWKEFVNANRNKFKTLVVADATDNQLTLLKQRYVNGLVGQLPFVMGYQSMEVLNKLASGQATSEVVMGTNLLQVLNVPLALPPLTVDANYLGNLVYLGYLVCAIITMASLGFAVWTGLQRKDATVKAAQPPFLIMICVGTLIMGYALIPLSFDDKNSSQEACSRACIAVPWFLSIGFTVCFSALFSKTWRLNKVILSAQRFQRIIVRPSDVLLPFLGLLIANFVILLCWTIIDPLHFDRHDVPGTDDWNRVIATYGHCNSSSSAVYLILLGLVNFTAILLANYQAYRGRHIQTAFSESKYIFVINICILQACIFGVPMLVVTKDIPQGFYVVMVLLVAIITLPVLLLIFVPKLLYWREENQGNPSAQEGHPNMAKRCYSVGHIISSHHQNNGVALSRRISAAN